MVAHMHSVFLKGSHFNIFSAYAIQTDLQLDCYKSKK